DMVERLFDRLRHGTREDPKLAQLTEQERKILDHIADGLTNRQIAEKMFLAEKTVKNYVSTILAKMGMSNRSEAAAYVARLEAGQNIDPRGGGPARSRRVTAMPERNDREPAPSAPGGRARRPT